MDEGLGGMDGGPVHHLHTAGNDTGRDDAGDAIASRLDRGEPDQRRPRPRRFGQDAHRHFGDDAQHALRTRHDAQQIVTLGVEMLAAQADHLARYQHHLHAQHVVGRHSIFQAMHAARILRDIAADGTGDLAGRIGGVIEAGIGDRLADAEIGHARLRRHRPVGQIDIEDTVEPSHSDHDGVGQRQCTARQRGARSARHHPRLEAPADLQYLRDLRCVTRQHHRHRTLPVGGQRIRFIGPQRLGRRNDTFPRHDQPQGRDQRVAARQHTGIGLRHRDHRGWLFRCSIQAMSRFNQAMCRMDHVPGYQTMRSAWCFA